MAAQARFASASVGAPGSQQERIEQARRLLSRGPTSPSVTVPRGATADQRFIAAALNYRRCSRDYLKAHSAWSQFAARGDYHDPLHGDHQTALAQKSRALSAADIALSDAEEALLGARS